ncbi:unnamed protein product [Blumeria hordei]|uniref:Uncharacterized protein n=1 Tax=Blumeria hordei TaxID=2867405 RepID=A0A383UUX5_BLUHO|nr:unnamed protein product [Blumeria hordei]
MSLRKFCIVSRSSSDFGCRKIFESVVRQEITSMTSSTIFGSTSAAAVRTRPYVAGKGNRATFFPFSVRFSLSSKIPMRCRRRRAFSIARTFGVSISGKANTSLMPLAFIFNTASTISLRTISGVSFSSSLL